MPRISNVAVITGYIFHFGNCNSLIRPMFPSEHNQSVNFQCFQVHIVFDLAIAKEAIPSRSLLPSELFGIFSALKDLLFLWPDDFASDSLGKKS